MAGSVGAERLLMMAIVPFSGLLFTASFDWLYPALAPEAFAVSEIRHLEVTLPPSSLVSTAELH